jgi:methionyl-tRNA formyltransferase
LEPQPEEGVTYADKIGPDDRRLDLSEPEQAERTVRALSPHIGAWAELHGRRVTIWRAHVEDGELVPDEVQPEGKRRMTYAEFLRGIR